jgi:hypothetical protein
LRCTLTRVVSADTRAARRAQAKSEAPDSGPKKREYAKWSRDEEEAFFCALKARARGRWQFRLAFAQGPFPPTQP